MKHLKIFEDWRARAAVNLLTFVSFGVAMYDADAPNWSYCLLCYMATRPSMFDIAHDLGSFKVSVRQTIQDAYELGMREAVRVMNENQAKKN